jgi:hypothetical protein
VTVLGQAAGVSLPVRRVVLVGLFVGTVAGVACLVVPQTAAAVVGGIGAACGAVCAQVGGWLMGATRRLGMAN